jgi:GNAT superfamily N-acetyltransferase
MREIRLLGPGDEEPLERFLAKHRDGGQLLRANLSRGGIEDRGAPYQATYAASFSRRKITSVAAHCWNGMLLLQADEAAEKVARKALSASGRPLTGLLGPWGQVVWVAWTLDLPQDAPGLERPQRRMSLDLEDLRLPEPLARGELVCRRARSSELELLHNWRAAFEAETAGVPEDGALRAAARRTVETLQESGDNWVLTHDGRLVAAGTVIGETDEAVQIGGVITPKALRNRGYGRAVVAGALRAARERGRARALLITNDPAAERAYRAIGFATGGEVGLVRLDADPETAKPGRGACISEAYGVVSARADRGGNDDAEGPPGRLQAGRS